MKKLIVVVVSFAVLGCLAAPEQPDEVNSLVAGEEGQQPALSPRTIEIALPDARGELHRGVAIASPKVAELLSWYTQGFVVKFAADEGREPQTMPYRERLERAQRALAQVGDAAALALVFEDDNIVAWEGIARSQSPELHAAQQKEANVGLVREAVFYEDTLATTAGTTDQTFPYWCIGAATQVFRFGTSTAASANVVFRWTQHPLDPTGFDFSPTPQTISSASPNVSWTLRSNGPGFYKVILNQGGGIPGVTIASLVLNCQM